MDAAVVVGGMFVLTVSGFAFWTTYGVLLGKWPIIATNAICFVLAGFFCGCGRKKKPAGGQRAEACEE